MQNHSLVHATRHAGTPRGRTQHVSAALPFIADVKNGTSYASWHVWSESTMKESRFMPMPRKAAVRIYYKALQWNGRGKVPGRHGGLLGMPALLVLHTMIFDFLNHKTGRLFPGYDAIKRKTRLCRQTVARALVRLKELGIIHWQRRCMADTDEHGRFFLRQRTNAYAVLPASQWHGYVDDEPPPQPHPDTWGSAPPLPSLIEQASADIHGGDTRRTVLSRLDADPGDRLASGLASLFRTVSGKEHR